MPFLGERRYIHLTSLVNAIQPFAEGASSTTFKLSRKLRSNRLMLAWQEELEGAAASCCFVREGKESRIAIVEGEPQPSRISVDYLEKEIVSGWTEHDGAAILAAGRGGASFIERAVALNKAFLLKRFPLGSCEQYLATRWEARGTLIGLGNLEIEHVRTIADVHLLSRVTQDGQEIGKLYFARQPLDS